MFKRLKSWKKRYFLCRAARPSIKVLPLRHIVSSCSSSFETFSRTTHYREGHEFFFVINRLMKWKWENLLWHNSLIDWLRRKRSHFLSWCEYTLIQQTELSLWSTHICTDFSLVYSAKLFNAFLYIWETLCVTTAQFGKPRREYFLQSSSLNSICVSVVTFEGDMSNEFPQWWLPLPSTLTDCDNN